MPRDIRHHWTIAEISLSVFVLFILFLFTYGIFVRAPYSGFHYDPTSGKILAIYVQGVQTPMLQEGDTLVRIGDVSWQEFHQDGRQPFFENVKAGENVDIVIRHNDQELTIPWKFAGFNRAEFNWRFFNIWWLPYVYWIFGTITLLFMRPRDTLRWLLIAANYFTGLFLMFGSLSGWHLWESSILLHAITWLILPVYLHLHWLFPKPLLKMPKWLPPVFYTISFLFALCEIFQVLPKSIYALVFLVALLGSVVLQVFRFIRQPEQRREVSLLGISLGFVIIPFSALLISGTSSEIAYLTFLALPFMPLSLFYAVHRRQMGGLELRANRLISSYAFLIILGTLLFLLMGPVTLLPISHEALTFLTIMLTLLTTFLCTMAFPTFQAFVEQHVLGIRLPYQNLQEIYSSRIAATASMSNLLLILDEEVMPSLLVRQFAFMQVLNGNFKALLIKNVTAAELPVENQISALVMRSGKYIHDFSTADEWMRLILPLRVGDSLIGFWLLGRRDPDDLYSSAEVPILQSLANQTAIALSNILHGVQLRKMYQSGIERYENERMRLALDLHDSVLNELAVLRIDMAEAEVSSKFQTSYQQVTHRLREIVSDLRPPMLIYGLKPAINEFADNLMERNGDKIRIKADLEASEERMPQHMELHLYRIVQEACENSLRYANPKNISIYGSLTAEKVDLNIHDDGEGFETNSKLELDTLVANRHFGLAGMIERAHLIDARINIHSSPDTGTRIHLTWKSSLDVLSTG